MSAEGVPGEKSDAFLVPPANLCELVGQIANGSFFRVGVHEQFTAKESGMLKLGANDDPSCSWDCYAENVGSLTVLISVTKQEKTE